MGPKLQLARKAALVGWHSVGEKIRPPTASTRDDVPISGRHVTSEWLTDVLCRETPGARVVAFHNPGGSSGTSERVALRVEYNEAGKRAGLPTELFTKATSSFGQRMLLGGAKVLDGEAIFYTELLKKSTVQAPYGYWGKVDPITWRSIVVMEDIAATRGATFMQPTTGFTRDQIGDLVDGLARMHGALWGDPAIKRLKTPVDHLRVTSQFLDIRRRCEVGMERARAVIPPRLLGQADRLYEGTERAVRIATDEMEHTLLHGDAHAGQTYMTGDGRMGLADWQCVQRGGWAFDFAYLVNSSLEPEDRRAWQASLIEDYLAALQVHGGPTITFDEALLAYRQQCFWPYTAWAFTIGRAAYQPKMQPVETCLAIVGRTATAIDDLDAFSAVGL